MDNGESESSRQPLTLAISAGSRRISHVPPSTTKEAFTGNSVYSIEKATRKGSKQSKDKESEIFYKAFLEIQEESGVLRRENQKLHGALLKARGEVQALSQENEKLKEGLSQLQQTKDWGNIIRGKDEEVKRLHVFIRKMSFDKTQAINNASLAKETVGKLKSKLRNKKREVKEVKELEKVQSKARILNETEKLRSERNNAVANLTLLEASVAKLRQETSNFAKVSEERKMVIQELHKRLSAKDRQVGELRKQLVMSRFLNK
ncbi:uncharacterized protein PF3D7_1120000-like [Montipora capricornis]|uniref:uncharacterized protein PF3D7_1120000-like n=1 Tax=Montipora capricornis TaxID=246305 RepID=UPI0035F200DC